VGPFVGSWDGVRDIKDDECGRSEYKGENHADQSGIFCFEGGYEGTPVWVVLEHVWITWTKISLTNFSL
jgi:hypothetical protein